MALKTVYDDEADVPEQYRDLFTETEGKWNLTGIEGLKTQVDIDKLNEANRKERKDHKDTKEKLKEFEGVDLEAIAATQTELDETKAKLEAGAGEEFDQEKFDAAVDKLATSRAATQSAPLQRDLDKMTAERDTLLGENDGFKTQNTARTITDAVRKASVVSKVIDTAMDDVLMLSERVFQVEEDGTVLTRDEVGVTPGIAPDIWLSEMQEKRPHWWPASTGGGANGSGEGSGFTNNPWSAEHWNMTEQGKLVVGDRNRAERMAKAAGNSIGGLKPVPKLPAATPQV